MSELRLGVIGLGPRGKFLLQTMVNAVDNVKVVVYYDTEEDRMAEIAKIVPSAYGAKSEDDFFSFDCDAVLIATIWSEHIRHAIKALRSGKHVGMEVGGAYSEGELWDLIHAVEESGLKFMLLENVCYMDNELTEFKLAREGAFGEIVYAEGGYEHDLRQEIAMGRENHHGRLVNFRHRNADLYPTHQLGPICKVLNINRGNRILSLSSMSSKARGLNFWARTRKGDDYDLSSEHFSQGDIISTNLICSNGELIHLTHGCSLPRNYSRDGRIQGTKGIWMEDKDAVCFDDINLKGYDEPEWMDFKKVKEDNRHPLWTWYENAGVKKEGHGGVDYLTLSAFAYCVLNDIDPPIDVYDAATWMAVTYLSEQSIAMGGAPVPMPDWTKGQWLIRRNESVSKWMLSDIAPDEYYK